MNAPCMKVDKKTKQTFCDQHYPQSSHGTVAVINDKSGRAEYRRPNNGDFEVVRQNINGNLPLYVCAANHDIVPYNPNMLLLLYEYHIYVEDVVTSANNIVQYIYKYITRNALFTRAKIGTAINDIE